MTEVMTFETENGMAYYLPMNDGYFLRLEISEGEPYSISPVKRVKDENLYSRLWLDTEAYSNSGFPALAEKTLLAVHSNRDLAISENGVTAELDLDVADDVYAALGELCDAFNELMKGARPIAS